MSRNKRITLKDIGNELGLSIHTVSKALRGLPGMSEATRRDVFDTARKLGYKSKDKEIYLALEKIPLFTDQPKRFLMIVTEDTPFFRLQIEGIQERFDEWGHSVAVAIVTHKITNWRDFNTWVERTNVLHYDGIFIPASMDNFLEGALLQLQIPKVLINFPPAISHVDSIIWDVLTAIQQSVQYFVSKGHQRILYIGNIKQYRGFKLRWQSFQDAIKEYGMEVIPEEHMLNPPQNRELWIRELIHKLSSGQFTAILCGTGHHLSWIYFAIQAMNKSIPEDYSLVSLENTESIDFPQLSRPALLIKESGCRAAERLLWRMANPGQPYEHVRLQGHFIEGKTVMEKI